MAGDLIGNTVLSGLIVTTTPGSTQTNLPIPASGGPAIAQFQSGVSVQVQSGAQMVVQSGATLSVQSGAQLSLATYSFSILTAAAATSIPNNNLGLVFRTSGISLVYVSGGTVYSFGSSGVGASFASGTA